MGDSRRAREQLVHRSVGRRFGWRPLTIAQRWSDPPEAFQKGHSCEMYRCAR